MTGGKHVWETPEYFARVAARDLAVKTKCEQAELERVNGLRTCRVTVRLTPTEHEQLMAAAASAGLALSDYVRLRLLG